MRGFFQSFIMQKFVRHFVVILILEVSSETPGFQNKLPSFTGLGLSEHGHRRRIKTEAKAKVVASVWGTEFIQFLAALAIFYQDDLKTGMKKSYSSYRPGATHPILQIVLMYCRAIREPLGGYCRLCRPGLHGHCHPPHSLSTQGRQAVLYHSL